MAQLYGRRCRAAVSALSLSSVTAATLDAALRRYTRDMKTNLGLVEQNDLFSAQRDATGANQARDPNRNGFAGAADQRCDFGSGLANVEERSVFDGPAVLGGKPLEEPRQPIADVQIRDVFGSAARIVELLAQIPGEIEGQDRVAREQSQEIARARHPNRRGVEARYGARPRNRFEDDLFAEEIPGAENGNRNLLVVFGAPGDANF